MKWRLIPYAIGEPAWNMAVDEALFQSYQQRFSPPALRFYGWDPPTVSLGYFQEWDAEINPEAIRERGYGLVRRCTGGRTVFHHHELTYAVVGGISDGLPDNLLASYIFISKAVSGGLQKLGVAAELHHGSGVKSTSGACFDAPSWYELTVEGRKVVGSAQLRQHGCLLQHGSILLDFSVSDLCSILRLEPERKADFEYKIGRRVVSLKELGRPCTPSKLAEAIAASFAELYDIQFKISELTSYELELAGCLAAEKYGNVVWNRTRGNSGRCMGG